MSEMPLEVGQIEIWLESEEVFSKLLLAMNRAFGCQTGVADPVKAVRLQESLCRDWDDVNPPMDNPKFRRVMKVPEGATMWLLDAPLVENKFALYAFVSGWGYGRETPYPLDPNDRVYEVWARTGP